MKHRNVDNFHLEIFHVQHDFWYTQDENGWEGYLEAGPVNGFLQLFPIPWLQGTILDQTANPYFFRGPGAQFCYNAEIMELAAASFPNTANIYAYFGPNSNSAAHYLMQVGGFSFSPPFWSIGWSKPVIGSPIVVIGP